MHATLEKFGYPQRCVLESPHWAVLLRPSQVTLGALVLCSKTADEAFPSLPPAAFTELRDVSSRIESALAGAFAFERINYLMLMMVDPQVHFHVLPRYSAPQVHAGLTFDDRGWPGPPDLSSGIALDDALATSLATAFGENLPASALAATPEDPVTPTR